MRRVSGLIDDLNKYGCSRETLRRALRRAAQGDLTPHDLAEEFGCSEDMAQRHMAAGRRTR